MGIYLGSNDLSGGGAGGGGGIDGGLSAVVTVISGGGGAYYGGGGAGGLITRACNFHKDKTYDIVVGAGGTGGNPSSAGNISYIETAGGGYLSMPGGGGGNLGAQGKSGACDGGSATINPTAQPARPASQVIATHTNNPIVGIASETYPDVGGFFIQPTYYLRETLAYSKNGGNGMGEPAPRAAYNNTGVGGNGLRLDVISDTFATANNIGEATSGNVYFCGGGGDGDQSFPGGGGSGNGDPNSGGGGGYSAGAGGSGIVFVQAAEGTSVTTTGTVVTETADGITTYCFKTSGTITFNS